MASRDYKHSGKSNRPESSYLGMIQWMGITAALIGVLILGVYLQGLSKKKITLPQDMQNVIKLTPQVKKPDIPIEKLPSSLQIEQEAAKQSTVPQFDFYTILPEKEVVVPEYEINTRTQEERTGDAKKTSYIMQAGSFKSIDDAQKSQANFAAMGIESRIERAKVGEVIWYRIKIGPYAQITSINALRTRLKQNGIDVIVTEVGH